ncbi:MAG: hypothetical protein CFE33_20910 [Pseudorhodobacter sp. PARRP1]|nr:MAG: hypothetical protein CFE33_20910 [Pseudorhodobacter sp. PARRP1]
MDANGRTEAEVAAKAIAWAGRLVPIPLAVTLAAWLAATSAPWLSLVIVAGLLAFSSVFAVNSSIHFLPDPGLCQGGPRRPRCEALLQGLSQSAPMEQFEMIA